MSKKQDMLTRIGELNGEVKTIFDDAGDDELDSQTWEKVKDNNKEIERLEGEVLKIQEQETARQKAAERGRLATPRPDLLSGEQPGPGGKGKLKSIGEVFVEDSEFKEWVKKHHQLITGSQSKFGSSPAVKIPGGLKALITGASATSAGALTSPDFLGLQDQGTARRPLTIRDIITNGQTDSDVVEFVRETGFTNNAAPVAEATATGGSSGAKPESALTLEVVTQAVKTIAHWIPITRRALADASQIRTYVESTLRYGVEEELEDQMLTGDGVGENFTGVMNTTGTSTQAWDTDLLTTTRRARTKVKTLGRAMATAYVFHPNDWEDLDLLQDNEARYYFGGPSVLGSPRLWGLPVVESEGMTEGFSVVADWRLAVLWDRMMAQILASDSHLDFFTRNIVVLLAEMRAAFTLLRPAAFVETDLTA